MNYQKMYTVLIEVIKRKVKRLREQKKDIETLIDEGVASNTQKRTFIELKAKIEAYEDTIDLAEGMTETE